MLTSTARHDAFTGVGVNDDWGAGKLDVAAAIASLSSGPCTGDCENDVDVTVNELVTMVSVALGDQQVSVCMRGDADNDGQITVDEILAAVNFALAGCSRGQ